MNPSDYESRPTLHERSLGSVIVQDLIDSPRLHSYASDNEGFPVTSSKSSEEEKSPTTSPTATKNLTLGIATNSSRLDDPDTVATRLATQSSQRVMSLLNAPGVIQSPLPSLISDSIVIPAPRYPSIFEDLPRNPVPLSAFKSVRLQNSVPVRIKRSVPVKVHDIGGVNPSEILIRLDQPPLRPNRPSSASLTSSVRPDHEPVPLRRSQLCANFDRPLLSDMTIPSSTASQLRQGLQLNSSAAQVSTVAFQLLKGSSAKQRFSAPVVQHRSKSASSRRDNALLLVNREFRSGDEFIIGELESLPAYFGSKESKSLEESVEIGDKNAAFISDHTLDPSRHSVAMNGPLSDRLRLLAAQEAMQEARDVLSEGSSSSRLLDDPRGLLELQERATRTEAEAIAYEAAGLPVPMPYHPSNTSEMLLADEAKQATLACAVMGSDTATKVVNDVQLLMPSLMAPHGVLNTVGLALKGIRSGARTAVERGAPIGGRYHAIESRFLSPRPKNTDKGNMGTSRRPLSSETQRSSPPVIASIRFSPRNLNAPTIVQSLELTARSPSIGSAKRTGGRKGLDFGPKPKENHILQSNLNPPGIPNSPSNSSPASRGLSAPSSRPSSRQQTAVRTVDSPPLPTSSLDRRSSADDSIRIFSYGSSCRFGSKSPVSSSNNEPWESKSVSVPPVMDLETANELVIEHLEQEQFKKRAREFEEKARKELEAMVKSSPVAAKNMKQNDLKQVLEPVNINLKAITSEIQASVFNAEIHMKESAPHHFQSNSLTVAADSSSHSLSTPTSNSSPILSSMKTTSSSIGLLSSNSVPASGYISEGSSQVTGLKSVLKGSFPADPSLRINKPTNVKLTAFIGVEDSPLPEVSLDSSSPNPLRRTGSFMRSLNDVNRGSRVQLNIVTGSNFGYGVTKSASTTITPPPPPPTTTTTTTVDQVTEVSNAMRKATLETNIPKKFDGISLSTSFTTNISSILSKNGEFPSKPQSPSGTSVSGGRTPRALLPPPPPEHVQPITEYLLSDHLVSQEMASRNRRSRRTSIGISSPVALTHFLGQLSPRSARFSKLNSKPSDSDSVDFPLDCSVKIEAASRPRRSSTSSIVSQGAAAVQLPSLDAFGEEWKENTFRAGNLDNRGIFPEKQGLIPQVVRPVVGLRGEVHLGRTLTLTSDSAIRIANLQRLDPVMASSAALLAANSQGLLKRVSGEIANFKSMGMEVKELRRQEKQDLRARKVLPMKGTRKSSHKALLVPDSNHSTPLLPEERFNVHDRECNVNKYCTYSTFSSMSNVVSSDVTFDRKVGNCTASDKNLSSSTHEKSENTIISTETHSMGLVNRSLSMTDIRKRLSVQKSLVWPNEFVAVPTNSSS